MDALSDAVTKRSFDRVKRGYDAGAVDAFLADVSRRVRAIEAELAIAHGKLTKFEQTAVAGKDANSVVQDAFRVATLRRDEIIAEARAKAEAIVNDARVRATAQTERTPGMASMEADVILEEAREEAGQIVVAAQQRAREIIRVARSEADQEAATAMVDARQAAAAAQAEYGKVVQRLRALKSAVNLMLQDGAEGHEEIRLVFSSDGTDRPA